MAYSFRPKTLTARPGLVDISPQSVRGSQRLAAEPSQQQGNKKAASKVAQEAVKAKEVEMAAADACEHQHANRPPALLTQKVLRQKHNGLEMNSNVGGAGNDLEHEGMY